MPSDAAPGNVLANPFVLPLDASLFWNAYDDDSGPKYWGNGIASALKFDPVQGLTFTLSTAGSPDTPVNWASNLFILNPAGNLSLPYGTISVARDPAAQNEVATLGWTSRNTVASFNQRIGAVTLTQNDVYSALQPDSLLATQNWVNQAIQQNLQNLLLTCPFVNSFNGRSGQVWLNLTDITTVFYQPGQQPISPTPPVGSNDDSIATTAFITDMLTDLGQLPITGGTLIGPLNYTATGGTTNRSLQSRAGEALSATDFGIVCDGVTDQGAALNAALASMTPGTTLYIPGSVYTSVTISLTNGQRIEMPPGALVRPTTGSQLLVGTIAIIGAATLSPVVQTSGNEGGLTNVWITRNGIPPTGAVGLQVYGQDQIFDRCRFYNHGVGTRVGGLGAESGPNANSAITTSFNRCMWWNCTGDFTRLARAPETTFIDCRWGINGATDPAGATSLVTFDGDSNLNSAAAVNTVSFIRCQFNTNGNPAYSIRFFNVAACNPVKFAQCYSGGATTAFCYIDPGCTSVQGVTFTACSFEPLHTGETFISDSGNKLNAIKIQGCEFGFGTPTSFSLSGTANVAIIGNSFYGACTATLDSMNGGCFIGNTINTANFTGTYTGPTFTVAGNAVTNRSEAATGSVYYQDAPVLPLGSAGYGAMGPSGPVTVAQVSASSGAVHFSPGAPYAVFDIPFYNNHGNNLTAHAGGGQANATQITTQMANVTTCVTAADSIKLPISASGLWQVVTNNTATSCQVFGTSPDTINGIATATGYALAAGKTLLLYCYSVGAWQGGVLS